MKKILQYFGFLILTCLLPSCATDQKIDESGSSTRENKDGFTTHHVWPLPDDNKIGDITPYVKSVRVVELSPSLAEKVGQTWYAHVLAEGDIILVDREALTITRINFAGEPIWHVRGGQNDYRSFQQIKFFTFDSHRQEILIRDNKSIFKYDTRGKYVGKDHYTWFDWVQFIPLDNETMVFSAQGMENPHLYENGWQLLYTKDDSITSTFVSLLPYAPLHHLYGIGDEFTRLNGRVLYHAGLRNTYHWITNSAPQPAFTFDFDHPMSVEEIMKTPIEDKWPYFRENRIPTIATLAADGNNFIVNYRINGDRYLGLSGPNTTQPDVNHRLLRHGDLVFEAPYDYRDGYAAREVSPEEVELLASLPAGATEVSDEFISELRRVKQTASDRGKKYLYVIEF